VDAFDLLQRYLDGLAEPAELAPLLAQRPDLAEALADACRLEALLDGHLRDRRTRDRAEALLAGPLPTPPAIAGRIGPPAPLPPLRRRRWSWWAAGLLFLAAGAALGYRLRPSGAAPGSAVVSGRVLIAGVEAALVPDGAALEVAGDSDAVIRLADGARAELGPASRAVLRGRGPDRLVELDCGRATIHTGPGGRRFQVSTPMGTVSVLDGAFTVELQPEEEEEETMSNRGSLLLVVAALVGQVEVHSAGRDYLLLGGQSRVFAAEGKSFVKPSLGGKVVAISKDGKTLTVETPAGKKGGEPTRHTVRLGERTRLEYFGVPEEGKKPTVGYLVTVWLEKDSSDAARVRLGRKEVVLSGAVVAVASDGNRFTLEARKKGGVSVRFEIQLAPRAKLVYREVKENRPTVGYFARVWLKPGSKDIAGGVVFAATAKGLDGPAKGKAGKKGTKAGAAAKKPALWGTISAVSADGSVITLQTPSKKGGTPLTREVRITKETRLVDGKGALKLAAGQTVIVWLQKDASDVAEGVQLARAKGKKTKGDKPAEKPKGVKKGDKPAEKPKGDKPVAKPKGEPAKGGKPKEAKPAEKPKGDKPAEKPKGDKKGDKPTEKPKGDKKGDKPAEKPKGDKKGDKPAEKPKGEPAKGGKPKKAKTGAGVKKPQKEALAPIVVAARPPRDPAPIAAAIDAELDRRLKADRIPASPQADDAEFLRRACLDLIGRIPTRRRAEAFLASKDLNKRRELIDELLASPDYGRHFATLWRNRIVPDNKGVKKAPSDTFTPWLAAQLNANRDWNAIVADLLMAEGPLASSPQSAFLLANAENFQPQPNQVAGAVAQLFWGVQLRCAECHNHPFAHWKQDDFWGTAAFFGRLRFTGFKGRSPALTETADPVEAGGKKAKGIPAPAMRGLAIVIPAGAGLKAGTAVRARFLGGAAPALDESKPLRPAFAAWATSGDNPYFARAAVNRLWAHLFGRGLVNPVDAFDETNPPTHPELLRRLTQELVASRFDLKHLIRCIALSKAYGRTSRPVAGNERDTTHFSHPAVKVLTAEAFFDSLAVVAAVDKNEPWGKGSGKGLVGGSREEFVRFFRARGAEPTEYSQGIPQVLRLLNGPLLERGAPIVDQLVATGAGPEEALDALFLTALSRRPRAAEVKALSAYLQRRKDAGEGYRGVLWILLNSSEFALNR
jgi:ferric-dicitrate binding protein FerR (iron transport regulator)